MTIDEGGVPTGGNLSDYVSGVLNKRARQEAETRRVKDLNAEEELNEFIQGTVQLRTYLLGLAAPIEEMLARFRVREVLEEARTILLDHQEKDKDFFSRGVGRLFHDYKNYEVSELRPPIYQQVVSPPQPTVSFQLESGSVDLEFLVNPNNFRRVIPLLEGYGLNLGYEGKVVMSSAPDRRRVWVEASSSHEGWSVGGGDRWSSQPAHWSWDVFPGEAPLRVIRSLSVVAVRAEDNQGYDLMYSHRLERTDLRDKEYHWPSQDAQKYLTPQKRIHAGDPTETLMDIVGNDIVKEVSGEDPDLLYKFLTAKVSKTVGGEIINPF